MGQIMKPFQAARTLNPKEMSELLIEYHDFCLGSDSPGAAEDWLGAKFSAKVEEVHFVIFSKATTADSVIRWLKRFFKQTPAECRYSVLHRKDRINVKPVQITSFEFVKEEPEDYFGKGEGPGEADPEAD